MKEILPIAQIVVSIFLIISVLLQRRGSSMGSVFGGGSGGFYSTRRGIEKNLFIATIIFGILFIVLALLNLFLK